jgi:DNA-binding NarL/FixJ family response regulator
LSSPTPTPIRVLIVDDHKIIRDGLRDLITSRGDIEVVGDAANAADACRLALSEKPDLVVLDLDLGDEDGLALLPRLLEIDSAMRVIILTGVRDPARRDKAMELGARGVVLKDQGASELLSAIEKVARTEDYWLEPGATRRMLDRQRTRAPERPDPEAQRIATLTPREREIIALVGEGLENKDIAERLRPIVAEATVRNTLSIIYDKLDIRGGRLGLLVYAYKHGLVRPGSK